MPGGSKIDDLDDSWHTYHLEPQENPLQALLVAVAAVTNEKPENMEILYDVVEPRVLLDLFEHPSAFDHGLRFSFRYNGCQIIMTPRHIHVKAEDPS